MKDPECSGLVPFDLHVHDLDFMVYAFGKPANVQSHRSKRPEQDYISATYDFGDFFITTEAAWYAAPLPFNAGFRFQFEDVLITFEGGKCKIYQTDDTILDLSVTQRETPVPSTFPRVTHMLKRSATLLTVCSQINSWRR